MSQRPTALNVSTGRRRPAGSSPLQSKNRPSGTTPLTLDDTSSTDKEKMPCKGAQQKKRRTLVGRTTGIVVILATVLLIVYCNFTHEEDTHFQWDEDGHPLVHTANGILKGVREDSFGGRPFLSFYSIPYATPPLGTLRFQDPIPEAAWKGVRNATRQPERCFQLSFRKAKGGMITEDQLEGTEDCLYLNAFVPEVPTVKVDEAEGLPVMVFLHGGGFVGGAAAEHEPYVLLDHDVILIVPQFRLGVLGFLSTEDNVVSGNYMLKDQMAALRWVQRNVRHFGGNPECVTIFGESAGGISTNLLAISPEAKGLFSRAVLHSGTALAQFAFGKRHRQVAEETAIAMGYSGKFDSKSILSFLQTVSAKSLTFVSYKYYEWFVLPVVAGPRVDGVILPADSYKLQLQAACPDYQLMTGFTAEDGALLTHHFYLREELKTRLKENFSYFGPLSLLLPDDDPHRMTKTTALYKYYLGENIDLDLSEDYTRFLTDYYFRVPSDLVAQAHAACAKPRKETFIFTLTHRGEQSSSDSLNVTIGNEWVAHLDDLIYLFPVEALIPGGRRLTRPEDLTLREIMTKLWVNFATTGNPTPDDSLGFTWEAVERDNLKYLALEPHPAMQSDHRCHVHEFYRTMLPHQKEFVENLSKLTEGTQ